MLFILKKCYKISHNLHCILRFEFFYFFIKYVCLFIQHSFIQLTMPNVLQAKKHKKITEINITSTITHLQNSPFGVLTQLWTWKWFGGSNRSREVVPQFRACWRKSSVTSMFIFCPGSAKQMLIFWSQGSREGVKCHQTRQIHRSWIVQGLKNNTF